MSRIVVKAIVHFIIDRMFCPSYLKMNGIVGNTFHKNIP